MQSFALCPKISRQAGVAMLQLVWIHVQTKEMELSDVYALPYDTQSKHLIEFLYWLRL